jgi:toxin HigB-1
LARRATGILFLNLPKALHRNAAFEAFTSGIWLQILFYLLLTLLLLNVIMIKSFGNKETERIWEGERVKKLPLQIQEIGRRKLRMLNNAVDLTDLKVPPANKLEKLSGNFKSFYSIRVNDQWRIIFKWNSGNASEVEIIDYH